MIVSLVLPCYNPPVGWEQNVCSRFQAFCSRIGTQAELVLVLDGESATVNDTALSFLKQNVANLKVLSYPVNRGKGYAIRQGVAVATGDVIMFTDVDFPYTVESMQTIYEGLKNNEYDVAVGVKNENYYAQVPFLRRAISRYLRFLISIFLSLPVTDTQCGLKGFRSIVKPLFLQTTIDRYLFDLEFVRNSFKGKKYRVKAIPVTLNENVQFRSMNYRILFPEMINFIKLLMK